MQEIKGEIILGKLSVKYDTFICYKKDKKNIYLNEFLKLINVDLSKCAKPEY